MNVNKLASLQCQNIMVRKNIQNMYTELLSVIVGPLKYTELLSLTCLDHIVKEGSSLRSGSYIHSHRSILIASLSIPFLWDGWMDEWMDDL